MLTNDSYRVGARSGRAFEEEILEVSGRKMEFNDFTSGFSGAIKEAIDKNIKPCPDTWVSRQLFELTKGRLLRAGLKGDLFLFSAVNTPADIFGVDAFFCFIHEDRVYIATIDIFYTYEWRIMDILREYALSNGDDRFENINRNPEVFRGMARNYLIEHYDEFQSALFDFKKGLEHDNRSNKNGGVVEASQSENVEASVSEKNIEYESQSNESTEKGKEENKEEKVSRPRPSNHFILCPFDIERGMGLKALSRSIVNSLIAQINRSTKTRSASS